MKLPVIMSFAVLALVLAPGSVPAAWQPDGTVVSNALNAQATPRAVPDGAGGAIVVWADLRGGTSYDIYAQRIDASGTPLWADNGIPICTLPSSQELPVIAPDAGGGAIIAWYDARNGNYDIYAQRVDATGVVQWTPDGVAVCTDGADQAYPKIALDTAGGALFTWFDGRGDLFAQRLDASGAPLWATNGVAVCTAAAGQVDAVIAPTGGGGAILAWVDFRGGGGDIYARLVNAAGTPQWTNNGVALCTAANDQIVPQIISDYAGGAIVVWSDYRGASEDIYAQRISFQGVVQWASNGVGLVTLSSLQSEAAIVPDGAGGAVVAWSDLRNGANFDVYAQRVSAAGALLWTTNGVAVSSTSNHQVTPTLTPLFDGGAIAAWQDYRYGTSDIYAQRIDGYGAGQWTNNGTALSRASGEQIDPLAVADGSGGAIVTWVDLRSPSSDVYAQRVEGRFGYWGQLPPTLVSASDNPNDQGGKIALNWTASGRDVVNQQTIVQYTIWRAVDEALAADLASNGEASIVDAPATGPLGVESRVFWRELSAQTTYYWELVGSMPANYSEAYSYLASTRQDSTGGDPATHYFRVVAEGGSFYNWPSDVVSGYSVDNLAPAAPLYLTAQRQGNDVNLSWNRVHAADLRDYAVYRATSAGVTPVPMNLLSNSTDSLLTDTGAPATMLYYIVTAYDVHANQSVPSNEAFVSGATGVGDTPAITQLTVLQNVPNPFGAQTEFQVGLPAPSDVTVEIYDVAGRRVGEMKMDQVGAGWRKIPFTGRDGSGVALASGVYFYKVTASGSTITRKMVIVR